MTCPWYTPPLQAWNNFLKICFSGKNKTMHALLTIKAVVGKLRPTPPADMGSDSPVIQQHREAIERVLQETGLSAARSNAMQCSQFVALFRGLQSIGCTFPHEVEESDDDDDSGGSGGGGGS